MATELSTSPKPKTGPKIRAVRFCSSVTLKANEVTHISQLGTSANDAKSAELSFYKDIGVGCWDSTKKCVTVVPFSNIQWMQLEPE